MRWTYTLAVFALTCGGARAQEEHHVDPIGRHTFPPELVIQHQRAIALTEAQRETIKGELQQTQSAFTDLQWDLEREMEIFVSLLAQEKGYASHCTSFMSFDATSGKRRRCLSFLPWFLIGGSSPGCSYRHSLLSL